MRTTRTYPTKLCRFFKRLQGSVKDGSDPLKIKNPSSPLFVDLIVNKTKVRTLIDTGSSKSIIHVRTIDKFFDRPFIQCQRNEHRTANNGKLYTNGSMKLKVQMKELTTTIVTEVSNNLCVELVLGCDWLNENRIDIINTEKCLRMKVGDQSVNVPFINNDRMDDLVFSMRQIEIAPFDQVIICAKTRMKNIGTALFEPSKEFIEQTELVCPNALVKIENGNTWITMINTSDSARQLEKNVIIGSISLPTHGSISFPVVEQTSIEINNSNELQCRICQAKHVSKRSLFEHLRLTGHYATKEENGPIKQIDRKVYQQINEMIDHLGDTQQKNQLRSILVRYAAVFDTSSPTTIRTSVKHTIEVENVRPIVQRPYRRTNEQEQLIDEMCEEFHRNKIIRPSQSSWASPVVLQKKKDGSWRFCIDYRRLNEVTRKDKYPLPRIQEIFDALADAKYFSKLDFKGGYHQVSIDERDRSKTAFVTRNHLWEYNVMPQGICNGPPTFQRIVNRLLGRLQWQFVLGYIDDIIIYSKTIDEHLNHVDQILSLLYNANFRLNANKCLFAQQQIQFLGHEIDEQGIRPCPEKTRAILNLPVPNSIKSAMSFVKMAEYYRNHIPNFSTLAQPLFDLTKKNSRFHWEQEQQQAFDQIKKLLVNRPLLHFPDSNRIFIIQVDASDYGIGAVLMQNVDQSDKPVAYMSQKLNHQQRNWNTTEKECFAVVSSIKKWHHYVFGRDFIVKTDHHSLCWLNKSHNNNPKLNRWRMFLQDYSFTIEHVKGKSNCVADCLSRYPIDSSTDIDTEFCSTSTQTDESMNIVGAAITRSMSHRPTLEQLPRTTNRNDDQSRECRSRNRTQIFTLEQLKDFQMNDSSINRIIENIDRKPFNNEYRLIDGLLHRKIVRFNHFRFVPVIPKSKVKEIIVAYHNTPMNGAHFGKDRTFYKIRERFYWPGMYVDIVEHIRSCPNCLINKYERKKPNGHLNPIDPPAGVWENIAMDFVGPIIESNHGHKYILVITDLLSRYVIAKATRDNSALEAAKVLVDEVILRYGCPNQLLTDNGSHFTSRLFNQVTSLCGAVHVFTTPYNPQANGLCERFNATMCDSLAAMCNEKKNNWHEHLSKVAFSYNTSRHSTTKFTPFEMMFGRLCKLPFDLPRKTTIIEPHQYVQDLHRYMNDINEMARQNIEHIQRKSKTRHDAHRTNDKHSIGQFVYIRRLGLHKKLSAKYVGPYQIIQHMKNSIYRVQNPTKLDEILTVHVNRIRTSR